MPTYPSNYAETERQAFVKAREYQDEVAPAKQFNQTVGQISQTMGNVMGAIARVTDTEMAVQGVGQLYDATLGEGFRRLTQLMIDNGLDANKAKVLTTATEVGLDLAIGSKGTRTLAGKALTKGRQGLKNITRTANTIPGAPTRVVDTGAARGAANAIQPGNPRRTPLDQSKLPSSKVENHVRITDPYGQASNNRVGTFNEVGYDPKNRQIPIGGDEMRDIANRMELESQGHAIQPTFNEAGYQPPKPRPPAVPLGPEGRPRGQIGSVGMDDVVPRGMSIPDPDFIKRQIKALKKAGVKKGDPRLNKLGKQLKEAEATPPPPKAPEKTFNDKMKEARAQQKQHKTFAKDDPNAPWNEELTPIVKPAHILNQSP